MFEVAELGHKVNKQEYQAQVPELRVQLLNAQLELSKHDFPVIVLISGVDGAGKGKTVNLLNEWLDPRYLRSFAFGQPTDEESQRPEFWRFWRDLPPKGRIGLYVGSWYSRPLSQRVYGEITEADLDESLLRINNFENALADDGALIIKVWLHLSKDAQKKRLKTLESNPETRWRVTERDHKHLKLYDDFRSIAEHVLRITSTGDAPWLIVEGTDPRYRGLTVGKHILERLNEKLSKRKNSVVKQKKGFRHITPPVTGEPVTLLNTLDLSLSLDKEQYKTQLEKYQGKLNLLSREALKQRVSSIIVLEGWDAAGKGGIIRRFIPALDARHYQVISIAAPTDEERAHHYLWRFWRHLPAAGFITMYDRSWYGRVLVERIEGFAREDEWMRAYSEINDFEAQLVEFGIVLVKYWVHISKDEQLKRFKAREETPFKSYKITDEDYRNRENWELYEHAVNDMVERTSTEYAPWTLLESNDKRYGRIKALKIYCNKLEKALNKK
ncbi:MAG: polyphosphate:AMP phosphotransferase [Gammaproteobacteria bacterium]|jgi:polyphosphate:AMP phosphotransferase